jgi:hypothetical protein
MDFFTKCYIPSLKKDISVNKITFGDFLQLNSYFQAQDIENASNTMEKICKKSYSDVELFSNFDKFVLLLHLYCNYFLPILKLIGKDEESNNVNYEVSLKHVLKESEKYKFGEIQLPKKIYYQDISEILYETGESVESIKRHISKNKILMFDKPEFIKNIPRVYFNCFDNTLFHFLKLVYSTNLKNLYKKIKVLKKEYNFLLSEIYEMSPKEIDFFLSSK